MAALAPSFPPQKNDTFEISAISMAFTSQLCLGSRLSDGFWYCALHTRKEMILQRSNC